MNTGKDMNWLKRKRRDQNLRRQLIGVFSQAGNSTQVWALRFGFLLGSQGEAA
jgi:hypothetical protein